MLKTLKLRRQEKFKQEMEAAVAKKRQKWLDDAVMADYRDLLNRGKVKKGQEKIVKAGLKEKVEKRMAKQPLVGLTEDKKQAVISSITDKFKKAAKQWLR